MEEVEARVEEVECVSVLRRSPSATSQNSESTQSSPPVRLTTPFKRVVKKPVRLNKKSKIVDWREAETGISQPPPPCREPYISCGFA